MTNTNRNNKPVQFNEQSDKNSVKAWMIENYIATSAAHIIAVCKPMAHDEYVAILPLTAEVLDSLTQCEYNRNAQEWRLRFRPSNGAYVRTAEKHGGYTRLCTTVGLEIAKAQAQIELEKTSSNVNPHTIGMGHAFECVLANTWGQSWRYDCTPYWIAGDIVSPNGEQVQCKRYGGSISESSVCAAIQATR